MIAIFRPNDILYVTSFAFGQTVVVGVPIVEVDRYIDHEESPGARQLLADEVIKGYVKWIHGGAESSLQLALLSCLDRDFSISADTLAMEGGPHTFTEQMLIHSMATQNCIFI